MSAAAAVPATLSKHDSAYATLRERIVRGSYGPGFRLVVGRLGKELDISGPPLREVLRRLEAEGLVEIEPQVGARVVEPPPGAWEQQMELLALLDGYALAQSAPALETVDLDRARELNDRMRHALQHVDAEGFGRLNREFHLTLVARCANDLIRERVDAAWERLDLLRMAVFTSPSLRGWESVREHDEILRLIADGAPAAEIERAGRDHKMRTVHAYLEMQQH